MPARLTISALALLLAPTTAYQVAGAGIRAGVPQVARSRTPLARNPETDTEQQPIAAAVNDAKVAKDVTKDTPIGWSSTPSGLKFVDEVVGSGGPIAKGEVIKIHYTVSLLSSGTKVGSSRWPLTIAVGKHDLPIWDEALVGMRAGGKRRLLVPPSAVPESQRAKVPDTDRILRVDIQCVGLEENPATTAIAKAFPPMRLQQIGRALYTAVMVASFIPYFLPVDQRPAIYKDGVPPEQAAERRQAAAASKFLGGDGSDLQQLFP